jgi:hypothetical protein
MNEQTIVDATIARAEGIINRPLTAVEISLIVLTVNETVATLYKI